MKAIKNFKTLFVLLIMGLTIVSCVTDDEFDIPPVEFEEPNIDTTTTIAGVKNLYLSSGSEMPIKIEEEGLFLSGYVVSSDESGNFFKELIIQDSPENPTAGISILTDVSDLYTFFEPGRKVYVKVSGLWIGEDAGVIKLGALYGEEVGRLSPQQFGEHISRSGEVAELVPTTINLDEVGDSKANTLIKLENMQFVNDEIGQTYADPNSTFGVNRFLESCVTDQQIILRNSGFADFKTQLLPEGSGSITAVLSKFNEDFQLYIRNTGDVMFDQPRCEAFFEEDFVDLTTTGPDVYLDLPGWTNVNISGGTERYEAREFDNNKYAQITAFSSGENPLEAWLVTPGIDLSGTQGNITFSFDTKDGFNNGEGLKVYISTDFSGDPTTATWTQLNAAIATGTSSGYADEFTPSGNIDISSYAGETVYFGFEYVGGDGGITTTYQIDNLEVSAN
jgi:hypothetical protein